MKGIFVKVLVLALLCGSFSSCLNKETPVPLKPKGEATSGAIDMSEDYRWQVYFSFKNNIMVGKNLITAWDLGFEATPEGRRVILNGAKFRMAVYPVNKSQLSDVNISDTTGVASRIDMPSGSLDSTAIGEWKPGNIFILNRGTDESGADLGICKIQIVSVDEKKYLVRFADFNGSGEKTIEISKDEDYNFSFLSFDNGGKTLIVEPPKAEWDIAFTKYTHLYYDLDLRYSVVGCLLNHYKTAAGVETESKTFEEIDLKKAAKVDLSSLTSSIGFEWKSYNINAGKFTVDATRFYIIRDQQDVFYKLRFVDFYNNGIKGNPQFEFQRL
ncbi:MAG: HmuY family protein [Chitinophagaceae bacterium]|jgi:hypothetical protein